MESKKNGNVIFLRFDNGDDFLLKLNDYLTKESINSGIFLIVSPGEMIPRPINIFTPLMEIAIIQS